MGKKSNTFSLTSSSACAEFSGATFKEEQECTGQTGRVETRSGVPRQVKGVCVFLEGGGF